ncbi:hypothetical protein SDC9_137070 [bioreactor metagenome]|uniref:Uncharacterized protein n=1 Tax=bioreactor metagenome TaxID=1076179 RepID=A0A645DL02_9ZZZZ
MPGWAPRTTSASWWRRCTPRASGSSSTGCPVTSRRTIGPSAASTAPHCTSMPTRVRASSPTGEPMSSISGATRSSVSWSPTPCTGCSSSTRMRCGWTRWRPCSTSTTRVRRASGCPTSTAAGRISTRSTCCAM